MAHTKNDDGFSGKNNKEERKERVVLLGRCIQHYVSSKKLIFFLLI